VQLIPTLIQTSPGSTQCTESTTSSTSWNIGGSVGWNALQGLNAALTGGVGVSNSQTLTCPQTTIENQSNLVFGFPRWTYATGGAPSTLTFANQWIWEVPFTRYRANQLTVQIDSSAQSSFIDGNTGICVPFQSCPMIEVSLSSVVPLPFGQTFALQPPVVQSVNPTCANAGTQFVISGAGFYPSLVPSVVIGGTPLDPSQYTTTSDTAITVIAPEMSGDSLSVVVARGSPTAMSRSISEIDFCDL
jgi:hypothetical protein